MKKLILIISIIGFSNIYANSIYKINKNINDDKCEECYDWCLNVLYSPSGKLQSAEFKNCYARCMGL